MCAQMMGEASRVVPYTCMHQPMAAIHIQPYSFLPVLSYQSMMQRVSYLL